MDKNMPIEDDENLEKKEEWWKALIWYDESLTD
jgi:hypothetical protein